MKRLIALLLTLVMVLAAGMIPAWAAEAPSDPTKIENPDALGYSASNVLTYPTDGLTDINNYNPDRYEATTAYKVANANGLIKLSQIVNGEDGNTARTFEGKDIVLSADISMSSKTINPIGYNEYEGNSNTDNPTTLENLKADTTNVFKGNFYGNGYKIMTLQLKISYGDSYFDGNTLGLFGVIDGALIRDVQVVSNSSFTMSGSGEFAMAAPIAAVALSNNKILNCNVQPSDVNSAFSAGIVARTGETNEIAYCTVMKNSVIRTLNTAGGVVAMAGEETTIKNCANYGLIKRNPLKLGGIIAWVKGTVQIDNSVVSLSEFSSAAANTTGTYAGGIVGYIEAPRVNVKNTKVYSLGTISFTEGAEYGVMLSPKSNSVLFTTDENTKDLTKMQTIACQVSGDTTASSIRIVSSLDSIDYGDVRFQIEMKESDSVASAEKKYNPQIKEVFESLVAGGQVVTPEADFGEGAKYYSTFVIDEIPSESYGYNFRVRTYVTLSDGSVIYGAWTDWFSVNSLNAKLGA